MQDDLLDERAKGEEEQLGISLRRDLSLKASEAIRLGKWQMQ